MRALLSSAAAHGALRRCAGNISVLCSRKLRWISERLPSSSLCVRCFRSDAALQTLREAETRASASDGGDEEKGFTLLLYDYPSFSAALAALFARRYHSLCCLPAVVLPFSSVAPLRAEDLKLQGLKTCYLLGFLGRGRFAVDLSRFISEVIAFDHRQSTAERSSKVGCRPDNLRLLVDPNKSCARAAYEFFNKAPTSLLNAQEERRVESILEYADDDDLRRRNLGDIEAFKIGLREAQPNLNCLTNPYVFDQLLEIDTAELISRGEAYMASRRDAARKLLGGEFKISLGRGLYGECLCIRADGHSHLSHEIGDELSRRSATAGLRPIGAVAFMQRGNLKMCLRSAGGAADTAEIAKAYGGGGRRGSSSFMIRMDEYGRWALPSPL